MIRILHCVASMAMGGCETFIMNVYRNIDRSKVQFDFILSFEGVYCDEIRAMGGKIYQIPFITQVGPFVYQHKVEEILCAHPEYKIIHSHMDKFSGLIMKLGKKHGIPVRIAHSHNIKNEGGLAFQLVKNHYGNMINANCTHRFACSPEAAAWLYGPQADSAVVVRNGIELSRFSNEDLRDKTCFTVGNIARFSQQKNHIFLLDIFSELHKLRPASRLVLAGTGALLEACRAKAEKLGIADCVEFLGVCRDIPGLLKTFDVLCMPSLFEGLGIALIEAQAAGVKCVTSSMVPQEANVAGEVTFLPLEAPAAEWAKTLLALDTAHRSDNRQKIMDGGYDISTTVDFLQDFYCSHMPQHEPATV